MESVFIKKVRCFKDDTVVSLRPITLLVGENSAGKSTALALTRVAYLLSVYVVNLDFNLDPFNLGAYEQIARFHGGRGQRSLDFTAGAEFAVGWETTEGAHQTANAQVMAMFLESARQPHWTTWSLMSCEAMRRSASCSSSTISSSTSERASLTSWEIMRLTR